MENIVSEKVKQIRALCDEIEKNMAEIEPYVELINAVEEKKAKALAPPVVLAKADAEVISSVVKKLEKHEAELKAMKIHYAQEPAQPPLAKELQTMEKELMEEHDRQEKRVQELEHSTPPGISWRFLLGAAIAILGAVLLATPETLHIYQPLGYIPIIIGVLGFGLITVDLWRMRSKPKVKTIQPARKKQKVVVNPALQVALMGMKQDGARDNEEVRL